MLISKINLSYLILLGGLGLRNMSLNKQYRFYYNLPLLLTKMIIFARKVGLFSSKSSSSTEKSSYYDCAEYKIVVKRTKQLESEPS
jgi:hypothetical protein